MSSQALLVFLSEETILDQMPIDENSLGYSADQFVCGR